MQAPRSRRLIALRPLKPFVIAFALLVLLAVGVVPVYAEFKHWVGPGLFWHTDTNWSPKGVPTALDDAVIGEMTVNSTVLLSENTVFGTLQLLNGSDLITQGLELNASDVTIVGQDIGPQSDSRLILGSSNFTGENLPIFHTGEVQISNGVVELTILAVEEGRLRGHGTFRLSDDTTAFQNSGSVIAEGGTLTIEATGLGVIEIDSAALGQTMLDISDANSTLIFDGPIAGVFNGTTLIGENSALHMTQQWTQGPIGVMHFDGGGGTALLTGAPFTSQGQVFVNSGTAAFNNDEYVIATTSTVTVADGAELAFANSPVQQGAIQLNGGTLSGAALSNEGDIAGFGTISNPSFSNNDTLAVSGSTLTINSATILIATNSTVTVADGAELAFATSPEQQGVIQLNGGTLSGAPLTNDGNIFGFGTISNSLFINNDTLTVSGAILTIDSTTSLFVSGSTTTLNTNLELHGNVFVQSSATFTGSADLIVGETGTLLTTGDVTFNHDLSSHGTIAPGSSPALININGDFDQSATGVLEIELGGTALPEFDRLDVSGFAQLDGTLSIALINDFVPDIGDTFEILTTLIVVDEFSVENLPILDGRKFEVIYNLQSVVLQVVVSAGCDTNDIFKDGFETGVT